MGQLTKEERYQIHALMKAGNTNPQIAGIMDRDRTVIWREIDRNSGERGYRPEQAHRKAMQRKARCCKPRKIQGRIEVHVIESINQQHSPEQIAGRLTHEHKHPLSHECIYQYIERDKHDGGGLHKNLRRSNRKRRKRFGSPSRQGRIPNRVGIEHRPAAANVRSRKGDWEADTVIGCRHQGALVTAVDRKTRYTVIVRVDAKTADNVTASLRTGLEDFPVCSITNDNGKEFAGHQDWGVPVFFCNAYASWERGTNENTNGLIRQYFPKQSNFKQVSDAEVLRVQNLLNHRPRKCLGYKTPHEVLVQRRNIRYLE
jgi:IS30 family transposase